VEQRPHPTHHERYYTTLVPLYGLSFIGLAVTIASGTLSAFAGRPGTRHALEAIGIVCFIGAALLAGVKVLRHAFARCPECQASLRRSHVDSSRSYYPCEACGVTWTCDCGRTSD
jgi:hypothetical protein